MLQLIVVLTAGWSANRGELSRYELRAEGWHQVGETILVSLGERGLTYQKEEGDKKSPAGKFAVGKTYDAAPLVCVDDPKSPDYNSMVVKGKGEDMRSYRRAIVIEFNPKRIRGAGSCVFLHDGATPTVGCTAMGEDALDELAAWLKPGAQIVQLPRDEYKKLKAKWKLP